VSENTNTTPNTERLIDLVIERVQVDTGLDVAAYRMTIQSMIFLLGEGGMLADPESFRRSVQRTSPRESDNWRVIMPILRSVMAEEGHALSPDLLKVIDEEL